MEDITLTSDEILSLIIAVYNMRSNAGLTETERNSYIQLTEKLKKIQSSVVFSEAASMFGDMGDEDGEGSSGGHHSSDFDDEEYIYESVPASIKESFLFDEGDKNKEMDVLFSLIKGSDNKFIAVVDLEEESLETPVESFKLVGNVVHVFERKKDKESVFEIELKEKEKLN
jgi:hypothetical protein